MDENQKSQIASTRFLVALVLVIVSAHFIYALYK